MDAASQYSFWNQWLVLHHSVGQLLRAQQADFCALAVPRLPLSAVIVSDCDDSKVDVSSGERFKRLTFAPL